MLIRQPESRYDVLVVGGGMVGAGFAALLARSLADTLSILVVEAVAYGDDEQPSFDARFTALSWSTRRILEEAGLWQGLEGQVTPIRQIQASDAGHFGTACLDSAETGTEALGYVAENRQLGAMLNAEMAASSGIAFLAPARVTDIRPRAGGMTLGLETNDGAVTLEAGLVVLADGGRSPICGQLGIEQKQQGYGQHALIANIASSRPHENVAYERFTDNGPLAVLPLADFEEQHRGALVWTVKADSSAELLRLPDVEFLSRLQTHLGYRLGRLTGVGRRFCYPLTLSVAGEQVRPALVLLGNVAHTLHPVAGQGFNLALRDVDALVRVLVRAMAEGLEPGSLAVLRDYLACQEPDQSRTILFTDRMTRLFSSRDSALVWARKFGMLSIDLLPPVRRQFARQAMGLSL